MPRFPGFPEKPHYNSVKLYLSELAKDIAEMVVDPLNMERFREQLKVYAKLWNEWKTAEEATQNRTWVPSMGRPECPLNFFSPTYNLHYTPERESKQLPGFYSLMVFIHDREWPHAEKINNGIISSEELIEKTFSAPRSTLEGSLIVPGISSGPDDGEIYVIEECFNHVRIDIREFYRTLDDSVSKKERNAQCDNIEELSDEKLFAKVAQLFEPPVIIPLSKNETWLDLDRFLKPWFESALQRLESKGESKKVGLLRYKYHNLKHYARGADFKSFRGWIDPFFVGKTTELAAELSKDFKELGKQKVEASGGNEAGYGKETDKQADLAKVPISELIKQGESHTLEFKETLEYDVKQNRNNHNLNKECLKTIAAFLNTDGGTLIIGVKDNGEITGIERDLQYVQRENFDGFELKFRNLIRNRFAPAPLGKVKINFEKLAKGIVCKIDVNPVNRNPIIHLDNEVYIRDGNMTRKLDGRDLTDWIQQRGQAANIGNSS